MEARANRTFQDSAGRLDSNQQQRDYQSLEKVLQFRFISKPFLQRALPLELLPAVGEEGVEPTRTEVVDLQSTQPP